MEIAFIINHTKHQSLHNFGKKHFNKNPKHSIQMMPEYAIARAISGKDMMSAMEILITSPWHIIRSIVPTTQTQMNFIPAGKKDIQGYVTSHLLVTPARDRLVMLVFTNNERILFTGFAYTGDKTKFWELMADANLGELEVFMNVHHYKEEDHEKEAAAS